MSKFNTQKFNDFIIDNGIIGFFDEPIKYKSGRMGNYYINWRNITEDVYLIDELANYILDFTKDCGLRPDCFYGVPEGGTKTAVITQYKWAKMQDNFGKGSHVLPMGRAKPKEHGMPKDKFFVGMPRGKVVVIEDTITTGLSLLTSLDSLGESGVDVVAVIGLSDRNEKRDDGKTPGEAVEEKGIKYFAMSNALDLLPITKERFNISEDKWKLTKEYFERYGVKQLS